MAGENAIMEFLAENDIVSVVPNFSHDKLYLLTGTVGPFEAGLTLPVPLWLAVYLKQRQKCQIVPPEWLNVETLQKVKQDETKSDIFTQMPSEHFMEIAHMLLIAAPMDIPHGDEIKTLIRDIWDSRMAKLRTSIAIFVSQERASASVNNLTPLEIGQIRHFLSASLDHLYTLHTADQTVAANSSASQ